eukprot:2520553-Rhodomonas_salina.1
MEFLPTTLHRYYLPRPCLLLARYMWPMPGTGVAAYGVRAYATPHPLYAMSGTSIAYTAAHLLYHVPYSHSICPYAVATARARQGVRCIKNHAKTKVPNVLCATECAVPRWIMVLWHSQYWAMGYSAMGCWVLRSGMVVREMYRVWGRLY